MDWKVLVGAKVSTSWPSFVSICTSVPAACVAAKVCASAYCVEVVSGACCHARAARGHQEPAGDLEPRVIQRAVVVGRRAVHQHNPAGHRHRAVDVQPVTQRIHRDVAAVDGEKAVAALHHAARPPWRPAASDRGRAHTVDAVVAGDQAQLAVVDRDLVALHPLVGLGDAQVAAVQGEGDVGMNAIVAGRHDQLAAADDDGAVGVERVIRGIHLDAPARDHDVHTRLQTLACSPQSCLQRCRCPCAG